MPFLRHRLRDSDVWARVDAAGALIADANGRVEIVYKPVAGAKVYRAGARNLSAPSGAAVEIVVGEAAPEREKPAAAASDAKPATGATRATRTKAADVEPVPADAIHVWTDGGAAPNPGPSGAGVVIVDAGKQTEISQYLGVGTNQTAELTAMLIGLSKLAEHERTVVVYSDSAYSIGLMSQGWKAKANVELVEEVRTVCRKFKDVRFVKVLGHSGVALNERCDELVGDAIRRRS